jgi:HAD superfamily hydrolase (TIGR01662 family)
MALRVVFFDVGETLVDEERAWRVVAARCGIEPQTLWAALGTTIERGEEHWELWRRLGLERPTAWEEIRYGIDDLYPDALACLESVRALGVRIGLAGNQNARLERWVRDAGLPVDMVASSDSLGVRKPDPAFFAALTELADCAAGEAAYVGDRVDNDVLPARRAGMVAVHLRRGPWGRLQRTPSGAIPIDSLAELPMALAAVA